MKGKLLLTVFAALLLAGCRQELMDESSLNKIESRSASSVSTFFINIQRYISDSGEATVEGDIYCPEDTEYTIIFNYTGTPGASYEARFGDVQIYPYNGDNFREITTTLRAGTHRCRVRAFFSGPDQTVDARIVIWEVNGSTSVIREGSGDLVVQTTSKMGHWVGSEPIHWTCNYCGCMLNSVGTDTCLSCGKSR